MQRYIKITARASLNAQNKVVFDDNDIHEQLINTGSDELEKHPLRLSKELLEIINKNNRCLLAGNDDQVEIEIRIKE